MGDIPRKERKDAMQAKKRILSVTVKRMYDDSPDTSWLGRYANKTETEFTIDRANDEFASDADRALELLEHAEDHLTTELEELDSNPTLWAIALDSAITTLRDKKEEWEDNLNWDKHEYRYFNPGTVEAFKADASWIPASVTDKEAYWRDTMRNNARQDYKRMKSLYRDQWCFIGIRADAEIGISCLANKGCVHGREVYYTHTQTITSGGLWGIESDSDKDYLESVEKEELSDLRGQLKSLGFSTRAISSAFKLIERKEE